jgi:hypothetical protein
VNQPEQRGGLRQGLVRKSEEPREQGRTCALRLSNRPSWGSVATWAALSGISITMIRKRVAEILNQHVTFELESIDRMYLNGDVPSLQTGGGAAYFMKQHLGARVPSTAMVAPLTKQLMADMERFATTAEVDLITFEKHHGKMTSRSNTSPPSPGRRVLFIGKAQEKAPSGGCALRDILRRTEAQRWVSFRLTQCPARGGPALPHARFHALPLYGATGSDTAWISTPTRSNHLRLKTGSAQSGARRSRTRI